MRTIPSSLASSRFLLLVVAVVVLVSTTNAQSSGRDETTTTTTSTERTRRHRVSRISPLGEPEQIDATRRRGHLDFSASLLTPHGGDDDDEDDDVEIQLMSDEPPIVFTSVQKKDKPDTDYVSWDMANEDDGSSMTLIQGTDEFGQVFLAGTVIRDGIVYQISADSVDREGTIKDVIVEERYSFDPERELNVEYTEVDFDSTSTVLIDGVDVPPDGYDSMEEVHRRHLLRSDLTDDNNNTSTTTTSSLSKDDEYRQRRQLQLSDDGSVLDIMVVYGNGAMCRKRGFPKGCAATADTQSKIKEVIELAIEESNNAYEWSGIQTRLRLVSAVYAGDDYDDTAFHWDQQLNFLSRDGRDPSQRSFSYWDDNNQRKQSSDLMPGRNQGYLDWVHEERKTVGADFVALLVDRQTYCGIGWLPSTAGLRASQAFSVTQWDCATGYYSFAHEIGHNMGCSHNPEAAGSGGNPSAYGYRDPGQAFRTILAYNCASGCTRVPRFSGPSVSYNGKVAGNSMMNNAGYINAHKATYAQYMPATMLATATPGGGGGGFTTTTAPPPTPSPPLGPERVWQVEMGGNRHGAHGNMFDIIAKKEMLITNFEIHARMQTVANIEVYVLDQPDTGHEGYEFTSSLWRKIGSTTFTTNGPGELSPLPSGAIHDPVLIKAGEKRAFYVTYVLNSSANLYTKTEKAMGDVWASNDDMEFLVGSGMYYAFGGGLNGKWSKRVWNGKIHYKVDSNLTPSPTDPLSTPPPTLAPTKQPTPAPTGNPTLSPTPNPTPLPTPLPTPFPTPAPTPFPTPFPTGPPVADPTEPPTPAPTESPTPIPTQAPTPAPTLAPTPGSTPQPTPTLIAPIDPVREITTFEGGNGQAGNMFEIRNTGTEDIIIETFDIHTYSTQSEKVMIWTKEGSYIGFETDQPAWTQICLTDVTGFGPGQPTPIDAEYVTPVEVKAGASQSFYVTMEGTKIRYTNEDTLNDPNFQSNNLVQIVSSVGKKWPFASTYKNRLWNGAIYYRAGGFGQVVETPAPTPAPGAEGAARSHVTTYANLNGSFGSMFDIKAKKQIKIHNFAIHTHHSYGAMVDVEVWKLNTPNVSWQTAKSNPAMWLMIGTAQVEGKGTGQVTQLPANTFDLVTIEAGEIQAFYICLPGGGLRYSNGDSTKTGAVVDEFLPFGDEASNPDLIFYEGGGVSASSPSFPRFGSVFEPRVFNGIIQYYAPSETNNLSTSALDSAVASAMDTKDSSSTSLEQSAAVEWGEGEGPPGWPCTDHSDCASNLCSGIKAMIVSGGTIQGGLRRTLQTSGSEPPLRWCLDEHGVHHEDSY